jgi:DNA ligase-1
MFAHPIDEEKYFTRINAETHQAEWKWDGIRVQVAANKTETKMFSRKGDDISHSFPDLLEAVNFEGLF